ncbi:hypothetical protein Leryth_023802 [Lithospermum erythrorhizon]|nr:hypothetical protein Leryth_023802 [Lithospermum erythrorhizon]
MESPLESSTNLELTMSIPGFSSSSGQSGGEMRDFDINQVPSGLLGGEEDFIEEEDESTNNGGGGPRKKLRLTKEQSLLLEESFRINHTLNPRQKEALAIRLNLKARQVEVWFQNRRARSKLKQTEMECEYLKRWFGSLSEQNRRLQKEVEQLRAMKVGPPTVMSPHGCEPMPASNLTMCPRCERVTTTTTTTTSTMTQDRGPTRTPTATLSTANNVPFLHQARHPSAAC